MKKPKPLLPKDLRRELALTELHFKNTQHVKALHGFVGQERALAALKFGIDIKSSGYNLYAMGPSGIGKYSLVRSVLSSHVKKAKTPNDWCYVYNFENPSKPLALSLPPGIGYKFQQDMKSFIDELGMRILSIFESKHFQSEMRKIDRFFHKKSLKISKNSKNSNDAVPDFYKEKHEKEKLLRLKLMITVIEPLIESLIKKYKKFASLVDYLKSAQNDMLEHANDLIHSDEKTNLFSFATENTTLMKYTVNLMVDNRKLKGAPLIFEPTPNYSNLICRVEYTSNQGMMVTNFTLIRPGDLHAANGGYLILEARKLKKNPEAWEALKSALHAQQIKVEPIEYVTDAVKPVSLEPMPIPLSIKVIILGDRNTYYSLSQKDPDFPELFKVAVDFDEQIARNKKNITLFARLIGTIAKREKLLPFHTSAVAAIIDHSSRLAEDIEKLSTHMRDIEDIIFESNYWACLSHKKMVRAGDVKAAINAQTHRLDRSRELYYEDIYRDFVIIYTEGQEVGQVNCLSVRRVGNFSYGHPTRVTARVSQGKGKLIDIQREIKMAGPMHSKAGLIIANFLASRFNQAQPFSLSASISFEQIYVWTDGDSASVGELCALLSALGDIPINQSLAVTGSIDQYGEVQAIGGVNEKIEGFFDVCKAKGLNGKQGVLIPAVNQKNLMLRDDVIEAAKAKKFFIYPINNVDEAMSLLTGLDIDVTVKNGKFDKKSVYGKIEEKLSVFSMKKNSKKPRSTS